MGIINVTPDSFYKASRLTDVNEIVEKAVEMIDHGATIIDIGAQSSRPGSEKLSASIELDRLLPALEAIAGAIPQAILSVDTFYSEVAKQVVSKGASIVNDISAGKFDEEMLTTVSHLNVPYILMHMKGEPATMQQSPLYDDVIKEVFDFFVKSIDRCRVAGIKDIIIDPGFGFGKSHAHNFKLLSQLSLFKQFDLPVLAGLSRKGTVYKTLNIGPSDAVNGTTVLNTIALMNGAMILRVHDVKEAVETVKLVDVYQQNCLQ